ncbi:MAG: glycosyltransferase [Acidobacteria bacterium]|nr:glycosyltransferase [Acidobacteriota bacterium]MBM3815271.1 glycosyltransferase [Acidimicrobiia bacterium]
MRAVSVILPTHNRRQQLARAVASIEAQTFRDFELIVVDDASTDGTAAWLREAGIAAITLPPYSFHERETRERRFPQSSSTAGCGKALP